MQRGRASPILLSAWLLGAGCLAPACSETAEAPPAPRVYHIPEGCQPLALSSCLLPFPSSFFETADPSAPSGVRVAYAPDVLPVSRLGVRLDPDLFARLDGFSPSAGVGILFYLGCRIDTSDLPSLRHPEASLEAGCPVRLIRYPDGEPVPFFVEADAQAGDDPGQAAKIRPVRRLDPATRYVCALLSGIRDASGRDVAPAEPFVCLRDGIPTTSAAVESMRERTEENLRFLEANGTARAGVLLAWDFTTASDETIAGPLASMRDQALDAWGGRRDPGYRIESVEEFPAERVRRRIRGTFEVPWFLGPDGRVHRSEDGAPAMTGWREAGWVAQIPSSVAEAPGPSPVLLFGHGFFGTAEEEMGSDYQRGLADFLKMVVAGTDWLGVSRRDLVPFALGVIDPNLFAVTADRLMQAQVNFVILTRLLKTRLARDPVFSVRDRPKADPGEMHFLGISSGAVQGGTYMALTPDVTRAVLNVPGAVWSLMIERSHDFQLALQVAALEYPDPLDRQVVLGLLQVLFDPVDPIHFLPRAVNAPLGTPAKTVLLQESFGDALVPNLATETLARSMGLQGLAPLVRPVYGVPDAPSPMPGSGLALYDAHPWPLPAPVNVPPGRNNAAHEACRRIQAAVDQMAAFLAAGGAIVQTCRGPCDPGSGTVPWSPVPPP